METDGDNCKCERIQDIIKNTEEKLDENKTFSNHDSVDADLRRSVKCEAYEEIFAAVNIKQNSKEEK